MDDCGIDDLVDALFNNYLEAKNIKKDEAFTANDTIMLNNDSNDNDKNSGCCGDKKDKKKEKHKNEKKN